MPAQPSGGWFPRARPRIGAHVPEVVPQPVSDAVRVGTAEKMLTGGDALAFRPHEQGRRGRLGFLLSLLGLGDVRRIVTLTVGSAIVVEESRTGGTVPPLHPWWLLTASVVKINVHRNATLR